MASTQDKRRLSYEEIRAGEADIRLSIVQHMEGAELLSMVEEYEEKADQFSGDTRESLEVFARLGREELAKRENA